MEGMELIITVIIVLLGGLGFSKLVDIFRRDEPKPPTPTPQTGRHRGQVSSAELKRGEIEKETKIKEEDANEKYDNAEPNDVVRRAARVFSRKPPRGE